MTPWYTEAVFYHIYPLGFCGVPTRNDFKSQPGESLRKVSAWIPHMKDLGVTALYLGPLFESESHGYDTVDYYRVDRRLGTNELLKEIISELHSNGIKVILDGVFNHVGRRFWAFRDLIEHGSSSMFTQWFSEIDFSSRSPLNDPFTYTGWEGHMNLVKLNLTYPWVKEHLLNAVTMWIRNLDIDGLRLDTADILDHSFLRDLADHTREIKDDFWLMGEVIHGDYTQWANREMLHSTTNYECYKGLYSSHNDGNYFEIAYSLDRLFQPDGGMYRDLYLYNFVDNHDVHRVATILKDESHLYPLHILLFTIPGIPSIYYGSEWGFYGEKGEGSDWNLRPEIDLKTREQSNHPHLQETVKTLSRIRRESDALRHGSYRTVHTASRQMVFLRETESETILVAVNSSGDQVQIPAGGRAGSYSDMLNGEDLGWISSDRPLELPPFWGRIIRIHH